MFWVSGSQQRLLGLDSFLLLRFTVQSFHSACVTTLSLSLTLLTFAL